MHHCLHNNKKLLCISLLPVFIRQLKIQDLQTFRTLDSPSTAPIRSIHRHIKSITWYFSPTRRTKMLHLDPWQALESGVVPLAAKQTCRKGQCILVWKRNKHS